ncbi:uncharacterized protein LOC111028636 [Myzus persicae]|uniref:uncharacterized protein LOC111028636 n=1 Tax=Myzus persicae TaxID=13164 RepID=UPI000B939D3B|nr:uncharacterized protein LOC111028636 [Myzus persicae]
MMQVYCWLSLLFVFICNIIIGDTYVHFSTECPRHIYQKQDYNHTLRIPETRISSSIFVDNLYHINKYGHVNFVCYRYMGYNSLPRPVNPKKVQQEVRDSCVDCDAGHLIPHLHGGTPNARNYFSQNSHLNKGFWKEVESSLEHKPRENTVVTIQLLYNYNTKSNVYNLLHYPPPTHIQAVIMHDSGNPNNQNPFIHECMNIRNEANHHFDGNILINKTLENIPLNIKARCIK